MFKVPLVESCSCGCDRALHSPQILPRFAYLFFLGKRKEIIVKNPPHNKKELDNMHQTLSLSPNAHAFLRTRRANTTRGQRSTSARAGLKNWKKNEEQLSNELDENGNPKGMTGKGMSQLVKMGLGAISGDITEINFDKENASRAVVMELEANNLEDSKGNPLSMKFMNNDGYTEDEDNTTKGGIMNVIVPVVLGVITIGGVVATLKALA